MISAYHKSTICVVDPRRQDYDELVARAPSEGAKVAFADTAREALRMRTKLPPEAWVVNLELPDMPGVELLGMLQGRFPHTPVYLVGEHYRPEDELAARCGGASMYVCKPLETAWLLEPRMSMRR